MNVATRSATPHISSFNWQTPSQLLSPTLHTKMNNDWPQWRTTMHNDNNFHHHQVSPFHPTSSLQPTQHPTTTRQTTAAMATSPLLSNYWPVPQLITMTYHDHNVTTQLCSNHGTRETWWDTITDTTPQWYNHMWQLHNHNVTCATMWQWDPFPSSWYVCPCLYL